MRRKILHVIVALAYIRSGGIKVKSRIISLPALIIIAILLISACSGNGTPPETPHDDNAPPPPPRQYFEGYDEEETEWQPGTRGIHRPVNLNGRVITVGRAEERWASLTRGIPFFILPSFQNEPDPATSSDYTRDRMIWDNARRVEQEFNFSIEEVVTRGPVQLRHQLRTSVAAGNPFADIVIAWPDLIFEAAVNNWIQPLDIIDLPGSDLLGLQIYSRFTAEGLGHAWAFNTTGLNNVAFTLGVNMDLINASGAPNPVDLLNSGHWTWDAMLEIMRHVTRDTTGDGTTDQWGLVGEPEALLLAFIGANDGMLTTEDLNYGLDHPNTVEAMAFLERILHEGLLRTSQRWTPTQWGFSIQTDWWSIGDGNAAFIAGAHWSYSRNHRLIDIPHEFAVVPLPVGPSNTSGNTWLGGWHIGLVLPQSSSWQPAELLMVMEEYFAWAGHEPERIGDIPIPWWNRITLEGENAVRQLNAWETMGLDLGMNIPSFVDVLSEITNNLSPRPHPDVTWWVNRTPQEAVIYFYEQMQRELDNFFR